MASIAAQLARRNAQAEGLGKKGNAIPFNKQDFQTLQFSCLQNKTLFCDDTFPAEPASLGYNELGRYSTKTRGVEWKRPTELCSNPQFIIDGATRTDICQGALGDCWLLAAIASLTLNKDILARVIPPGQSFQESYAGIFHFQLWQYGEWVDVVIDDRLPTRNGELLFLHSAEGSEFWSALLEKAYAKVNGCYEALSGGSATEGFEDFTGGISEMYELRKAPPYLFKIIQKALGLGSLLGCSIDITSSYETEAVTSQKLVKGHAYSITGAEEVHVHGRVVQLVRIRNPWGQVEWTGPWSDNSSEWNSVRPEEKEKLDFCAEDGEFWMAYSDFVKQYSRLEICNLTPDTLNSDSVARWNYCQFEGIWMVGSTAGGCRNNQATFCSNPQFAIILEHVDDDPHDGEDGCTFLVGLMQKDGRKERKFGRDLNTIGFAIYKVKKITETQSLKKTNTLQQRAVAMSNTFINLREVCNRFKLPPGEYVIVPSTFEPHKKGNFVLRVFSEKQKIKYIVKVINLFMHFQHDIAENDVDPHFRHLFMKISGDVSSLIHFCSLLCDFITSFTELYCLDSLQKDGNGKLGLIEFHVLWLKLQKYLEIFKKFDTDNSGTISSHEIRGALNAGGFQVNNTVLQVIVSRYADAEYGIDFDCFVDCMIRLEMLYSESMCLNLWNPGTNHTPHTINKLAGPFIVRDMHDF
uniref:Calpain 8 n=1 Tax=Scleropages formosus TaxID=113540 RepID=A0A8C9WC07_SCLFO